MFKKKLTHDELKALPHGTKIKFTDTCGNNGRVRSGIINQQKQMIGGYNNSNDINNCYWYFDSKLKEYNIEAWLEVDYMTKDSLELGMVVEQRCGDKRLVVEVNGEILFMGDNFFGGSLYYTDDLKNINANEHDIIKVYKTKRTAWKNLFDKGNLTLIWTRESAEKQQLRTVINDLKTQIKEAEDKLSKL